MCCSGDTLREFLYRLMSLNRASDPSFDRLRACSVTKTAAGVHLDFLEDLFDLSGRPL